jgi:hypothetical protein
MLDCTILGFCPIIVLILGGPRQSWLTYLAIVGIVAAVVW